MKAIGYFTRALSSQIPSSSPSSQNKLEIPASIYFPEQDFLKRYARFGVSQMIDCCCYSLSLQYSFKLCSCRGGFAVPVLLAAHLHPCATHLHGGHRLLSHAFPSGDSLQLAAQAQGTARGGGTDISQRSRSLPHVRTNIATPSCAFVTYHVCCNRTLCQVCTCVPGCVPALWQEYLMSCHQIWGGNSVSTPLELCLRTEAFSICGLRNWYS